MAPAPALSSGQQAGPAGATRLRNTHASVSQISTVAFTRDVGRTDSRLPEICELNKIGEHECALLFYRIQCEESPPIQK